ncbi:MAG TPA: hypothetical protein VMA32_12800 [Streptosporangiaceae bacterium]|nr:hypothetical protein [Streptosporangiaceae bacterium]
MSSRVTITLRQARATSARALTMVGALPVIRTTWAGTPGLALRRQDGHTAAWGVRPAVPVV